MSRKAGLASPTGRGSRLKAMARSLLAIPKPPSLASLTDTVSTHFGEAAQWRFDIGLVYNDGKGGLVHSVELIGLPGRAPAGVERDRLDVHDQGRGNFTTERGPFRWAAPGTANCGCNGGRGPALGISLASASAAITARFPALPLAKPSLPGLKDMSGRRSIIPRDLLAKYFNNDPRLVSAI